MLLQEAILQQETMRKAGDWQQVRILKVTQKIRLQDGFGLVGGFYLYDQKICLMPQAGEQAVDQGGHWPPQTGACSWQVG